MIFFTHAGERKDEVAEKHLPADSSSDPKGWQPDLVFDDALSPISTQIGARFQEMTMRTMFDPDGRNDLLARLRRVQPDTAPLWGRMTAPQMLAHLGDQMRMTLNNADWTRMPGYLRYPGLKQAALYVLPWPRARIQGPPEAFVTPPTNWAADLEAVEALVARFVARGPSGAWPAHSHFGPLSGRQWGVFCYRHFDHHVRQFGA